MFVQFFEPLGLGALQISIIIIRWCTLALNLRKRFLGSREKYTALISTVEMNLGFILRHVRYLRILAKTVDKCRPVILTFLFSNCPTLVSSLVLSRPGYCNALLAGSPRVLLDQIQRVISCSARLIFKVPKSASITPFFLSFYDLHWLPISSRIQYKIALICFHIVSGTAPPYLSELIHL